MRDSMEGLSATRFSERAAEDVLLGLLAADPRARPRRIMVTGTPGNGVRALATGRLPQLLGDTAVLLRGVDPAPDLDGRAPVVVVADRTALDRLDPDAVARSHVVLCAAPDDALPAWFRSGTEVDVIEVPALSLAELHEFLAAHLDGDVDLASARDLGQAAGYVPAVVTALVRELRRSGALVRTDELWRLSRPLDAGVFAARARMELAALPEADAALLRFVSLTQPVAVARIEPAQREPLGRLLAAGFLRRRDDERVELRAPVLAAAIRATCGVEETERTYLEALARPAPAPHVLRWAVGRGQDVADGPLHEAVAALLGDGEWAAAIELAEAALPSRTPASAVRLLVDLSHAWRFRSDALEAEAALVRADGVLGLLDADERDAHAVEVAIARAEIRHYHVGDLDGALDVLARAAAEARHARGRGELVAHRLLHLGYGGRHRRLLDEYADPRTRDLLARADAASRARVRVASCLALAGTGSPRAGYARAVRVGVEHAVRRRSSWLGEELAGTVFVCAMSSTGPARSPGIARSLDGPETSDRSDDVTFELARASWWLARGQVERADVIARRAHAAAELRDPSGFAPALVALRAHLAALLGDADDSRRLLHVQPRSAQRSSASIAGSIAAHRFVAEYLTAPTATTVTERLLAEAEDFVAAGHLGFAAETLHSGVRFGARRAAQRLLGIGAHLDGALHALRVDHARALVDRDPIALHDVAERFARLGLPVLAAEAAAATLDLDGVPEAVRRKARTLGERLALELRLPGHDALRRFQRGAGLARLTPREREIDELIAAGLSNTEIAGRLHLSLRTVEGHITRLYRKTGTVRRAPARRL